MTRVFVTKLVNYSFQGRFEVFHTGIIDGFQSRLGTAAILGSQPLPFNTTVGLGNPVAAIQMGIVTGEIPE